VAKAPAPTSIPTAAAPAARPAVSPPSPRPEAAKPSKPPPAAAKPTAAPKSPDEACSGLGFFRKAYCLNRECASARFEQHPQCVKQRRESEARERDR
jgi:hypothetical protein